MIGSSIGVRIRMVGFIFSVVFMVMISSMMMVIRIFGCLISGLMMFRMMFDRLVMDMNQVVVSVVVVSSIIMVVVVVVLWKILNSCEGFSL